MEVGGLIRAGAVESVTVEGEGGLSYFRYVPTGGGTGAPLFVSVHGRSRNAARHGVGHSFADCMTVAGMGTNVFAHLFGPKPAAPA